MIKILSGPNRAELESVLKDVIDKFTAEHGDFAVERFDGEEVSFDTLIGAVSTLPFLAEQKLVIIKRLSANKSVAEKVEELLNNLHETVQLVIVEDKLDKRSTYYKVIKKLEGFSEFKELDEREMSGWIVERVVQAGGKISHADANLLINRVGTSSQNLKNEIAKLLLYNPEVSRQSIELLTDMTPKSSVFNLLDKAFAGDTAAALRLYDEQRQQNVEPFNILALIIWQLHAVALAKTAGKISSADLANKSGLSPYTATKALNLAQGLSLKEITSMVSKLADLEYKSKTSSIDIDDVLKNFIASL